MANCRLDLRQECRSLLQKAVRRGDTALVTKVASRLSDDGDSNWIRARTAILLFEECWPLGSQLELSNEIGGSLELLVKAATSIKRKDAVGLGTLGLALSQGDRSVLGGDATDRHIRVIAEAIKRPADFWRWIPTECTSPEQTTFVAFACEVFRRGGWPWDRAFVQAAAYLAARTDIPIACDVPKCPIPCPYWVAIDKHTSRGKHVLGDVARMVNLSQEQILWVSFYFESAIVNDLSESLWWEREIKWRLKTVHLEYEQAICTWQKFQVLVCDMLATDANRLREYVETTDPDRPRLFV